VPNPAFWAVVGGAIGVLTLVLALPPLRARVPVRAAAPRRPGDLRRAHLVLVAALVLTGRLGLRSRGDTHEGWLAGVMISAALVATGLALAQSGAQPLDDSQPPELAPDDGRAALRRRMSRHGAMLDALASATLRLDRPNVAKLAAGLERDTGLGAWPGPDAGAATRKSLERVESQLRARAHTLADVARRGSDSELPAAFGSLMETCVQCHHQALAAGKGQNTPPR
jgi:hypothetical protein